VSAGCDEHHCITCSDEGVPMRVLEALDGGLALCEGDAQVMTDLVGDVSPGDRLLVHAGVALLRLEGAAA
jgi:hydrogenase maturation factor